LPHTAEALHATASTVTTAPARRMWPSAFNFFKPSFILCSFSQNFSFQRLFYLLDASRIIAEAVDTQRCGAIYAAAPDDGVAPDHAVAGQGAIAPHHRVPPNHRIAA